MISVSSKVRLVATTRHFFKIFFTHTDTMREKGKQKESKHCDIVIVIIVTVCFYQTP